MRKQLEGVGTVVLTEGVGAMNMTRCESGIREGVRSGEMKCVVARVHSAARILESVLQCWLLGSPPFYICFLPVIEVYTADRTCWSRPYTANDLVTAPEDIHNSIGPPVCI